jgi:seryl-tRNA(Sec) selenium transferase
MRETTLPAIAAIAAMAAIASEFVEMDALRVTGSCATRCWCSAAKEEIAGLLVALERFAHRDDAAFAAGLHRRLVSIAAALSAAAPRLQTRLEPETPGTGVPTLALHVPGAAETLSRTLQHGDPPVHLGEGRLDADILTLNPQTVREDDDATLVRCLLAACASLPPASPTTAPPP